MITFKEALKLLNIKLNKGGNSIYFVFYNQIYKQEYEEFFALKDILNYMDISKYYVRKINYEVDYEGCFLGWELWVCDKNGKDIDVRKLQSYIFDKEYGGK